MGRTLDIDKGGGENPVRAYAEKMKLVTGEIDFDTSYTSGGEALDLTSFLPKKVKGVFIENKGGYVFEYDYTNYTVKAIDSSGSEVAGGTDLSAVTGVRFIAWGL